MTIRHIIWSVGVAAESNSIDSLQDDHNEDQGSQDGIGRGGVRDRGHGRINGQAPG